MSWLDALLGKIFSRGVEVAQAGGINFKAPFRATLNPETLAVDVDADEIVEAAREGITLGAVMANGNDAGGRAIDGLAPGTGGASAARLQDWNLMLAQNNSAASQTLLDLALGSDGASAARLGDLEHILAHSQTAGFVNLTWDNTNRRLGIRAPSSGSGPHGIDFLNNAGVRQAWIGWTPGGGQLVVNAGSGGAQLVGAFTVPSGSSLTVPNATSDDHAVNRGDVFGSSGIFNNGSWTPSYTIVVGLTGTVTTQYARFRVEGTAGARRAYLEIKFTATANAAGLKALRISLPVARPTNFANSNLATGVICCRNGTETNGGTVESTTLGGGQMLHAEVSHSAGSGTTTFTLWASYDIV